MMTDGGGVHTINIRKHKTRYNQTWEINNDVQDHKQDMEQDCDCESDGTESTRWVLNVDITRNKHIGLT